MREYLEELEAITWEVSHDESEDSEQRMVAMIQHRLIIDILNELNEEEGVA